jgi:hypothetical protein
MEVPEELLAELNSCAYLFLRVIEEPTDNQLRIVIEEASVSSRVVSRDVCGVEFSDLRPIESTPLSRLFEITWNSYVAYSVRNESFTTMDDYEQIKFGRLAAVYTKSRFLDYVAGGTFACEDHPGPICHIGVNCQNHILDVASAELPVVRHLRPHTAEPQPIM